MGIIRRAAVGLVAAAVAAPLLAFCTALSAEGLSAEGYAVPVAPSRSAPAFETTALDTWEVQDIAPTLSELTAQVPVWDMVEVNGVMYVGGQFLHVREDSGATEIDQPFLAAFDATTGVWVSSFRPQLDGAVFSLDRSPDGSRLYVGGEFSRVNGAPWTGGLVALEPATGALVAGWRAHVTTTSTSAPVAVMDIEAVGEDVIVGGSFTHISGPNGAGRREVVRIARLRASNGRPVAAFSARIEGGRVFSLATSPNGERIYAGGYFTSVNGSRVRYFTTLRRTDGSLDDVPQGLPRTPKQRGRQVAVFDIAATRRKVFVASEFHMLHVIDARTGIRQYAYGAGSFGGDYQALAVHGRTLWTGGHMHGFQVPFVVDGRTPRRFGVFQRWLFRVPGRSQVQWATAHDTRTGRALEGFIPKLEMTEGVWDIEVSASGRLWLGGDPRRSQGQRVGGFAVFAPRTAVSEVNLALGVAAEQSSTTRCCAPTMRVGRASLAVDGKTANNYSEMSSSWTQVEPEPWWQIDLGTNGPVDRIRVWPLRSTGNFGDFTPVPVGDLRVFVSSNPFAGPSLATVQAQAGVDEFVVGTVPDTGFVEISVDRNVRYVRVQIPGEDQLGLAEVEVIAGDLTPIPWGASWQWLGSDPGAGWDEPAFDRSTWAQGPAPIGYDSDHGATTVIPDTVDTLYLARTFNVADPSTVGGIEIDLVRDDGAVVYLNGVEVARVNMPDGPITHTTAALTTISGAAEVTPVTLIVPTDALVAGANVLAVEVHNAASSSDLRVDLRLRLQ